MAEPVCVPAVAEIAGLILAGGQGIRMGGCDKGWVTLGGEPLVAHVARRVAPQVGQLVISANRHLARYAQYGEVVPDTTGGWPAGQGPLAGVAAGLSAVTTAQWVLVVPCDTPFLPRDLASRLIAAALRDEALLARAVADGQGHPVCMVLHKTVLPRLHDYLQRGERRVGLWQSQIGVVDAVFDNQAHAFMNINTPQALQQAEHYLNQCSKS